MLPHRLVSPSRSTLAISTPCLAAASGCRPREAQATPSGCAGGEQAHTPAWFAVTGNCSCAHVGHTCPPALLSFLPANCPQSHAEPGLWLRHCMACCNRQPAALAAVLFMQTFIRKSVHSAQCSHCGPLLPWLAGRARKRRSLAGCDQGARGHRGFACPCLCSPAACWLVPTCSHATRVHKACTMPAVLFACAPSCSSANTALSKSDSRDKARSGCSKGTEVRVAALVGCGVVGEEWCSWGGLPDSNGTRMTKLLNATEQALGARVSNTACGQDCQRDALPAERGPTHPYTRWATRVGHARGLMTFEAMPCLAVPSAPRCVLEVRIRRIRKFQRCWF